MGRRMNKSKADYYDTIENMVQLAINEMNQNGYNVSPTKFVKKSDMAYILFDFKIKYIKQKGIAGKLRNHTDKWECTAKNKDDAVILLKQHLKKLKESLVEVISLKHTPVFFVTKNLEFMDINNLELLPE
jgi:hypothetical protein